MVLYFGYSWPPAAMARRPPSVFTHTMSHVLGPWLDRLIPDFNVTIYGFHTVWAGRDTTVAGKKKGVGLAVLVNNLWCELVHILVKESVCVPTGAHCHWTSSILFAMGVYQCYRHHRLYLFNQRFRPHITSSHSSSSVATSGCLLELLRVFVLCLVLDIILYSNNFFCTA